MTALGGAREVSFLGQRDQVVQLFYIHVHVFLAPFDR
jgi:hypothetical protein